MKKIILFCLVFFIIIGLVMCNQSFNIKDEVVIVNVKETYPEKEIILQDFTEVEYIPLETNDNFLTQGTLQVVGKNILVITNRIQNGDIFIFDRNGKAMKRINHKGQGAEEYTNILRIALDEDKSEIFVDDYSSRRIVVYDLDGNFKRSFKHKKDAAYNYLYNFDQNNLICYDGYFSYDSKGSEHPFLIISKEDGSVTKEIHIPFEEKIITKLSIKDENNMTFTGGPSTEIPIIPYMNSWILMEASSDTIYSYLPDNTMTPLIARFPSILSMDPQVFLFTTNLSEHYYFLLAVKKIYDFETGDGYPITELVYDKDNKTIFRYKIYNGDYSNKRPVYMLSKPVSNEIICWESLDAYRLVEDYKGGKLKGKLKQIASGLDEDSNPVIMLAKHIIK